MKFHSFEWGDPETMRWTNVVPGDMVRSPGSFAFHTRHLTVENMQSDNPHGFRLRDGLLLVIAAWDGAPDVCKLSDRRVRTFIVLSRHGLLFLLQNHDVGRLMEAP